MTDKVTPYRGASSVIRAGGAPQVALFGPMRGGIVYNPLTAADQGLTVAEVLWLDLVAPATVGESPTTVPVWPGDTYIVPPGDVLQVSVNAATTGHRFTSVLIQDATPFPPTPPPGPFPPSVPGSLSRVIPSYLYEQYADDEDLQAFVSAYNSLSQQYVDWLNTVNLPVYPGLSGGLLDWVGTGLYGYPRPSLSSGHNRNLGPFNTYVLNGLAFNRIRRLGVGNVVATSDDVYKRAITWHFYKGDGKVFNLRWLKRRVMRFLNGASGGAPNIDNTYAVSVTFGVGNQVNIRLASGVRSVTGGAIFNRFRLNSVPFNRVNSSFTSTAAPANAPLLKEAIDSGVLELPFQFTYVVTI